MYDQNYLDVCHQIEHDSHDIRQRLGLNHLWVFRCYYDGYIVGYGLDQEWNDISVNHNWHGAFAKLHFPTLKGSTNPVRFQWSSESTDCSAPLKALRMHDNTLSGCSYLISRDDYIESIGFGSHQSLSELNKTLISNAQEANLLLMNCIEINRDLPKIKIQDWDLGPIEISEAKNTFKNKALTLPLTLFGKTHSLTGRQAQVLIQVAQGKGYKSAAQGLDVSTKTIEYHIYEIRKVFYDYPISVIVTELHKTGLYDILKMIIK